MKHILTIFYRFLDKNSDGKINYNELKLLIQMTRKLRNMPLDQEEVSKEVEVTAK